MARQRYNGLTATLGAALTSSDTTITFAAPLTSAAGAVPTISGGDTIALSLLDAGGAVVEIVSLTAYTSGTITGTITRAQESTTAAAHASGATVVHAPTAADFATSSAGPSSIKDRLWTPGSSETTADEFNDDSLDAAWVRVDNATTASGQTWTEGADSLAVKNTSPSGEGGGVYHAILRPIGTAMTAGDGFETCFSIMSNYGSGYSMISGLVLADGTTFGTGAQVLGSLYFDQPSANVLAPLNSMSNFSSPTAMNTLTLGRALWRNLYMRIVMTAANTWRMDVSPNGVAWISTATGARTLTPTHVGFATSNASGATALTSFEFLRRVSGA